MSRRTRREFLVFTAGGVSLLSGCVADEVARAADEAKRIGKKIIIRKAAKEGVDRAEENHESTKTRTPANQPDTPAETINLDSLEDVPDLAESQRVFLEYGEYFAEKFQAPAGSTLEFEVSGLMRLVDFIEVFSESGYEHFRQTLERTGETDGGLPLAGDYRDGTFIYNLRQQGTYAIVLGLGPTIGETTPEPVNVELTYRVYEG